MICKTINLLYKLLNFYLKKSSPFMRKLKLILVVMSIALLSNFSFANGYRGTSSSYDKCKGQFDFRINLYEWFSTGDDDWLSNATIYYKNIYGNWVSVIYMHDYAFTGNQGVIAGYSGYNLRALAYSGFSFNTSNGHTGSSDISSNYNISAYREDAGNEIYFIRVLVNKLPSDIAISATGATQWKVSGQWANRHNQDNTLDNFSNEFQLSLQSISAPPSLNATQNLCGQVDLSWNQPSQVWHNSVTCSNYGSYEYVTSQNSVASTSQTSTSKSYTALAAGTSYTYGVRTLWRPNGNPHFVHYSNEITTTGTTKGAPVAPSFTLVSNDRCDQKIQINWDFSGSENPTSFSIEYATTSAFSNPTIISGLSGTSRSYQLTPPATNTNYSFRIKAINNCGISSAYSSVEEGRAEGLITAVNSVQAIFDSTNQVVRVSWVNPTGNSAAVSEYKISRIQAGQANVDYQVAASELTTSNGRMTFTDENIQNCVSYRYQIRPISTCNQNGAFNSTTSVSSLLNIFQNISATLSSVKASKGYYSNRVQISWSTDQRVALNNYEIWRKIAGSTSDSVKIATVLGGVNEYNDETAVSGFLYQYFIRGKLNCIGITPSYTNALSDIGYKSPSGSVSGRVTFTGGFSLKGAKIVAERSNSNLSNPDGYSLAFNGSNQYVSVDHSTSLNFTGDFTIEMWVRPTNLGSDFTLLNKTDDINSSGFKLHYDYISSSSSKVIFELRVGSSTYNVQMNSPLILNSYSQISISRTGTKLSIASNGSVKASSNIPDGAFTNNTRPIIIGASKTATTASSFFSGNIDDVRIWGIGKDTTSILKDYGRLVSPSSPSLLLYLNFDENLGSHNKVYDQAFDYNNQQPRENHGTLIGSPTWSNTVPGSNNLAYLDYTDENGYYTISNIRYLGTGETFRVVPSFESHNFGPALRNLFIGEGASIHNGIDFIDSSSFIFKGRVYYGDSYSVDSLIYNPAPGINVYIDGNVVIQNGTPLVTNSDGEFDIRVPIGEHTIKVGKNYHSFLNNGNWPLATSKHNFQADILSRVMFIDTTKVTLTGRIVGGPIEFAKPYGLTAVKSKNNIGIARINLTTTGGGTYSKTYTTLTNSITGEYVLRVFPLFYGFSAQIVNNNENINLGPFGNINLTTSSAFDTITFYDTTYTQNNCSTCYILSDTNKVNFIYPQSPFRRTPILYISKSATLTANNFNGSDSIQVGENRKIGVKNPDGTYRFGYPFFEQGKRYSFNLFGFEKYTNFDGSNPVISQVPYQGYVQIRNDIKETGSDEKFQLDSSGRYTYAFIAGSPNTVYTNNDTLSFTKKFEAFLYPDNQYLFGNSWLPQPARAIIIGGAPKSGGFDFLTVGPNIIDFVVRRPPGSSSVATIAKGRNYVSEETNVAIGSTDTKIGAIKQFGIKSAVTSVVAPGSPLFITEQEVKDELEVLANVVSSGKNGWVKVTNTSTNFAISTQPISGLPGHVANLGDVYVGKSENYRFSDVYSIEVVPTRFCTNPSVACPLPPSADSTSLAIITTRGYSKEGLATSFAYSEYEIVNNIIPLLERKRNDALADSTKYFSFISNIHHLYGSNNDDPLWLTQRTNTNPSTTEYADTIGPSYRLMNKPANKSHVEWDEVRKLNQDIRLWKEAIANNEKIKYQVTNNRSRYREIENFSFDSRTKITKSYTTETGEGTTREWEAAAGLDVTNVFNTEIAGSGIGIKASTTTLGGRAGTEQSVTTLPMTWEFTLEDNDLYDRFTVDVYDPGDGGSPVFINRGGRSRCPYEGPVYSKYYDPAVDFISSHTNNANKTIADGTVEIEAPVIEVIGSSIRENVPASSAATFTIRLKNNSNHKLEYQLGVAEESNPNGAIVKIDGLDPSRLYNMDSQMVVVKVVTIERGPESYVYDDIEVEFESPCEERIKSSVKLSARFTPTCTDLGIKSPFNNWVVNTKSNNRLPVVIENYDINFSYFNNFQLEYKSKAASEWKMLERFTKDAAVGSANHIPRTSAVTTYEWDSLNEVKDGLFEIRAVSNCYLDSAGLNIVSVVSPSKEGIIDLTRPRVFGTPSPGDGILSPNDDISIQFTEDIDNTLLRFDNFEIKGIPNTAAVKHNATLYFDGINDKAEVQQSPNFAQKSFTMSFYAMPKRLNQKQVIISQGVNNNKIEIGFDEQNRFYAIIGNSLVRASRPVTMSQKVLSPNYTDTTEIRCFTVSYNKESETILLYVDNERMNNEIDFVTNYTSFGKLIIGADIDQTSPFKGNITDFRLFNKALTNTEILVNLNKRASISDAGILHNWSINEGSDTILLDKIRRRELTILGPQWVLSNPGRAVQFNSGGTNVISINSGTYPITNSMDMTMEFWFKSSATVEQVLMSTGNPQYITNTGYFEPYWQFKLLNSGLFQIGYESINNKDSFIVSNAAYNDGNWHHFAMVISRTTNLSSYIDGKLVSTKPAQSFPSFASSQLSLGGVKKAMSVAQPTVWIDKRFVGNLDEFRVWELARTAEQIANEKNTRLTGKEMGLKCYLPFETYKDNANVLLIDSTLENQADSGVFSFFTPNNANIIVNNISPVIKLAEPITNYPVTFLTNKDKIILVPEVSAAAIENTTLNITVSGLQDKYGNTIASPKTWIAYIDKNQVKWDLNEFVFEKLAGQSLIFTNDIINSGGENKQWSIGNLPWWIKATPSSGIIPPNSTRRVSFTIDPNVNIGNYDLDLSLVTNFGYNHKMYVKVKVYANPPSTWTVNPNNFSSNMNIVGQIKIGNTFSTNGDDIIAAFVNGQCRGLGKLNYYSQSDKYVAYLTVYTNNPSANELVTYQIWNATEGKLHSIVESSNSACDTFKADAIYGSFISPVIFTATDKLTREIILNPGWNWISFNLHMPSYHLNQNNGVPGILSTLSSPTNRDRIRLQYVLPNRDTAEQLYAEYDSLNGWVGDLKRVDVVDGYRYYSAKTDTITIVGNEVDPTLKPIKIIPGWNWIGFLSQRNLALSTALGNFDAKHGDLIKSQSQFAMFVNQVGWVGTLNTLIPNKSYMLHSVDTLSRSIVYPRSAMFGKKQIETDNEELYLKFNINPSLYSYNSSIIASVKLCDNIVNTNRYYLIAETNDEIRGVTQVRSSNDQHNFYLTAFGNKANEKLNYFLYDIGTKQKIKLNYQNENNSNNIVGSFSKPVVMTNSSEFNCSSLQLEHKVNIYPVPFTDFIQVELVNNHEGNFEVKLFDIQGRQLLTEKYKKSDQWSMFKINTQSIPEGTYLIQIISEKEIITKKLIK